MPKLKKQDGPDLFDFLDEVENGPPPCPHSPSARSSDGWTLEYNTKSDYCGEWVHFDPTCRRSRFPGRKHRDG